MKRSLRPDQETGERAVSASGEKIVPKGGPDGGNGGDGGSIIIRATKRLYTLRDFSRRRYFKAKNGGPGRGKSQTGRNSPHCIIETPVGTIIQDDESGEILADLIDNNQEIVLISGGRGAKETSILPRLPTGPRGWPNPVFQARRND